MFSRKAFATTSLALAALVLTTGLSAAATVTKTGPKGPTIGLPTADRVNIAEPGEPFFPQVDDGQSSEGGKTSPWDLSCHAVVNADGTVTITVTSEGDVIPKGYIVAITLPGDNTVGWLVSSKWLTGQERSVPVQLDLGLPPGTEVDCTASVHIKKNPNHDPNVPK